MNAWGSQCQPDVRNPFHTVLPFGCILAGPFPAEERHRETRLGARGEGGGEFKLTHYPTGRFGSEPQDGSWVGNPAQNAPRPLAAAGRIGDNPRLPEQPQVESSSAGGRTMERERAQDFDQELLDLYDDYAHARVDRRDFIRRASAFAVAGVTAEALLHRLRNYP